MEDNVSKEPTTTVTETKSKKNMMWLVGGAVVLISVVVVVVILLLMSNAQRASSNLTSLDPANPEAATQLLNNKIRDVAIAASTGDVTSLGNAFSEIGEISSAEFDMNLKIENVTGYLEVTLLGKAKGTSSTDSQGEFMITIEGLIPDQGINIQAPAVIDLITLPDTIYFKINNLIDQLPEEQAFALSFLGVEEDQWYAMPNTASENTASESPVSSLSPISLEDLQESLQGLSDNPVFINSTAASPRTLAGVQVPCMKTNINPSAGQKLGISTGAESTSALKEFPPIEICANPGSFFPAFVGLNATEDGSTITLEVSISSLNGDFTVVAPQGAVDFNKLIESFY